jgi:hypothetical protein
MEGGGDQDINQGGNFRGHQGDCSGDFGGDGGNCSGAFSDYTVEIEATTVNVAKETIVVVVALEEIKAA